MSLLGSADVDTSAGLYRRLGLDDLWCIPFSLWKSMCINGLLWIIHANARCYNPGNYTRVRTWQKCAWLTGVRPNVRTYPAQIFDTAPFFGQEALVHFAASIGRRRAAHEDRTLGGNVRAAKCASWNVTSLQTEEQRELLLPTIKAVTNHRILMVHEGKLESCGHALEARIPMTHVFVPRSTLGGNGGRSAGLVTFVRRHITLGETPVAEDAVTSYVHHVTITSQGLCWRYWTIYAPHGKQTSLADSVMEYLEQKGRGWIDQYINILGGDFNRDPARPDDTRALNAWRAVAARLDAGFVFSECGTFQAQGSLSNIDHFAVPELIDRHDVIQWKVSNHGPPPTGRHRPITLDGIVRSRSRPPKGFGKHSTLRADLFLRPSVQRDILVRRNLDVAHQDGLNVDGILAQQQPVTESVVPSSLPKPKQLLIKSLANASPCKLSSTWRRPCGGGPRPRGACSDARRYACCATH